MSAYRFVGRESIIHDTPHHFKRFGQRAEMDDAFADTAIASGVPLVTDAKFQELFDADDAAKPIEALLKQPATASKVKAAWQAVHEHRESLKSGQSKPEFIPVAPEVIEEKK
jgi:hypothetical protein